MSNLRSLPRFWNGQHIFQNESCARRVKRFNENLRAQASRLKRVERGYERRLEALETALAAQKDVHARDLLVTCVPEIPIKIRENSGEK